MRAAFSDYRNRVLFSGEGNLGSSESRAVLDGNILARNLAKNPMCSVPNITSWNANNGAYHKIVRNLPVPSPHPLGITTCGSSEILQSTLDLISLYNVDGRDKTDTFKKWVSVWILLPVNGNARINNNAWISVQANTWTLISGLVPPLTFTGLVARSSDSEVGMVSYMTGATSVLSPDIPPCFSGESKDIDRIRIADWYAGLTDDQRLESIAGPPLAAIFAPSGTKLITDGLGVYEGRTIYCVADIINTELSFRTLVQLGLNYQTDGSILIQQGSSGSTAMSIRVDTKNGAANNSRQSDTGIRVPGARLFMWASITSGMTQMLGGFKGPSQDVYYPNISPGEGMESNPTFSALSNTSTTVCCGLSYRGAHDLATRTRIFDWLMRRYKR